MTSHTQYSNCSSQWCNGVQIWCLLLTDNTVLIQTDNNVSLLFVLLSTVLTIADNDVTIPTVDTIYVSCEVLSVDHIITVTGCHDYTVHVYESSLSSDHMLNVTHQEWLHIRGTVYS